MPRGAEPVAEPASGWPAAEGVRVLDWSALIPDGEDPRPVPYLPEPGLDDYLSAGLNSGLGGASEHDPDSEGGTLADAQVGTFNTMPGLDGETVRLPGYIVPLDFSNGEVSRFLLVPYYGACIHAPPPPPNQTLYVESETPIRFERLSQAVWIEGEMSTGRFDSDMGKAAYAMSLREWRAYDGRFIP